jgi:antitoxin (DNA-binding transcriptional repressor) of toxin-antitoxin stability system
MRVTATKLRQNVYAILDEVLNGTLVEIERNGKILRIVAEQRPSKLARIKPRPEIWAGSPEEALRNRSELVWREPKVLDALETAMSRKKRAARKRG